MYISLKQLIKNITLFLALFFLFGGFSSHAEELTPVFTLSTGGDGTYMKDGDYNTSYTFQAGDTISVTSKENTPISGLYIIWDSLVPEWTLHTDAEDILCGQHGFLHEYISLNSPAADTVINILHDNVRISDIRVFGEGTLTEDVQIWNPPCERADILLVPAHADDEILFFGGIIPTYGVEQEAQIQVAYMSEFWSSAKIREHEKLDGLWEAGLRNYPVCGNFKDVYSDTLEKAQEQYNFDDMTAYITEQIRRFKPQVIVTHDEKGEYGHGFHMLTSKAVTTAVEAASNETQYTDSASLYGIWDTPKTYLHLYKENMIRLDLRSPIESMGGRTALEIAADAYKKHVSQQWCWFYVSDDYEYSCAEFGLYRTLVGTDSLGNDLLENLKTYKVQQQEEERLEAEQRKLEEERLERERKEQEEQLRLEQEKREQEEQLRLEQEKLEQEEQLRLEQEKQEQEEQLYSFIMILLIIMGILLTILIIAGTGMILKRKNRK